MIMKQEKELAKKEYAEQLAVLTDQQLEERAKDKIWLSAFANNNPHSDYHWQADATYDECKQRGKMEIWERAHKRASGQ